MAQFAKRFYVTHPAVVKWDKMRIAYIELEKIASEKNAPIEIRADALAA